MEIPEHLQGFLSELSEALKKILGDSLAGVYLHGSLTYGGYVKERSDTDLLVLLNNELPSETSGRLDSLFTDLSKMYPGKVKNIELDMLSLKEIGQEPAVLHSQYTFMSNKIKGPETLVGFWVELANTRENGIVVLGPRPEDIIPVIDRDTLVKANKEKFVDLQKNAEKWEQIDLWNQIYLLVQASRVLYSLNNDLKLVAKQDALAWAVENAPDQFTEMLKVAQAKLYSFEGPREKVISDNWRVYFKYVEGQLVS